MRHALANVVASAGALTVIGAVLSAAATHADVPEQPAEIASASTGGIPQGRTILILKDPPGYSYGYIFEKNHSRMRFAWTPTAGHPTCSKGKIHKGVFRGKTGTDYPSGLYVRRERIRIETSPTRWTLSNPDSGISSTVRALSRNGSDHAHFRRRMNSLLDTYCPTILARM